MLSGQGGAEVQGTPGAVLAQSFPANRTTSGTTSGMAGARAHWEETLGRELVSPEACARDGYVNVHDLVEPLRHLLSLQTSKNELEQSSGRCRGFHSREH